MDDKLELGIIGLGRIGGGLGRQALSKGLRVVGHDRRQPADDLMTAGLEFVTALPELRDRLASPRAVFLYVPAGPGVDALLDDLAAHLEPGDIIVDGGNSYWGDSIRRYRRLLNKRLGFVDLGTSGGVEGALTGACFMAGGERQAVERIEPILTALAVEGGYVHAGPPGAGHFTKLVHNGIEFGMLQAIGEGVDLLEHYPDRLAVVEILRCWRHGSVIRSWLIELLEREYRANDGMQAVPPYVEDTGEVNWLVEDALRMEVPVPIITQAVVQLLTSRDEQKHWARAVAMMRHGFGGHPYGRDEAIARERRDGRLGGFVRQAHREGMEDEPASSGPKTE